MEYMSEIPNYLLALPHWRITYQWGLEDELDHIGKLFAECWSETDIVSLAIGLMQRYLKRKEEGQCHLR